MLIFAVLSETYEGYEGNMMILLILSAPQALHGLWQWSAMVCVGSVDSASRTGQHQEEVCLPDVIVKIFLQKSLQKVHKKVGVMGSWI